MSTTTSTPYSWLKKIPASIVELDEIPLFGHPPPFPWEGFTAQVAKDLDIQTLTIKPSKFQWRTEEELLSGLGDSVLPLNFTITPFEGKAYWVMDEKSIRKFMTLMLMEESGSAELLDKEYAEGFYRFLALEAIHALEQTNFDPNLSPQLNKNAELPSEPMLGMDVALSIQRKRLFGRLFISSDLRKSIRGHYTQKTKEAPFTSPLAEKLEVTIHLEFGSTTLTLREWSQLKPGDFL
ncbi:MAG: hypothetical protein ACE5GN_00505, partial [Waddliaceae bacterium]